MSPSKVHAATTVSSLTRIAVSLAVKCSRVVRLDDTGGSAGSNRWKATFPPVVAGVVDEDGIA